MFDKIKGLMEMRKKLEEIKKELDKTNFDIEGPGGIVKITMNGSQEVQEVTFGAGSLDGQKDRLQKDIKDTFNRAIKRSQEIAAQKMKEATGINLPGM
ncbi:MAG: YbaB/EbfC family nucleoid-associated protein [Candidatus Omnitrophica bacterium]|nr:YbaB/EbfC family nucleoid-associated protein [Candidatus Omnitrophota bacterium]